MKLVILLSIFCANLSAQTFTLQSKDLSGQGTKALEFDGFGCDGKNVSPELHWSYVPARTKSYAITMYDPDAPTGSGWWHWLVFDLPSSVKEIASNAGKSSLNLMPKEAIQSITDFKAYGFGGPCPPKGHGIHQYIITIYALDVDKLGLDKDANPATVGFYLHSHTIEKASLVVYYKR
jgi:Raf kinase inhibitor-like YbhB/YbcL family protein